MPSSKTTIRALRRGLEVLRILQHGPGMDLHGLHTLTGLPKPTLLRILCTLQESGYTRRGIDDRLYHAGSGIRAPSQAHRATDELIHASTPVLMDLCKQVLWPSDLAVRNGTQMQIRETNTRHSPIHLRRNLDGYYPPMLLSALGRAYISFCSEDERQQILAACRRSKEPRNQIAHDRKAVDRIISTTRGQGYGILDPSLTTPSRLNAIAVPILQDDRVRGCVNLVWPKGAAEYETIVSRHLGPLQEAAKEIARQLASPDAHG